MNARPMSAHEAEAVIQESRRAERKVIEEGTPTVLCAWCPAVISIGTLPASHGICDRCVAQFNEPEPRTLASDMSEDR